MTSTVRYVEVRATEEEIVAARIAGVDAEVPVARIPVERTVEIGGIEICSILPVEQDIAQIHIALAPVSTIQVIVCIYTHQFKKSSVSVAMKNLREKGHITVTDAGYIYLTDSGKKIAEMVYERHDVLMHYLISLGVAEKTAEEDACKIEHIISEESFQAIKNTFTQK